jgi:hypothetical protein
MSTDEEDEVPVATRVEAIKSTSAKEQTLVKGVSSFKARKIFEISPDEDRIVPVAPTRDDPTVDASSKVLPKKMRMAQNRFEISTDEDDEIPVAPTREEPTIDASSKSLVSPKEIMRMVFRTSLTSRHKVNLKYLLMKRRKCLLLLQKSELHSRMIQARYI